ITHQVTDRAPMGDKNDCPPNMFSHNLTERRTHPIIDLPHGFPIWGFKCPGMVYPSLISFREQDSKFFIPFSLESDPINFNQPLVYNKRCMTNMTNCLRCLSCAFERAGVDGGNSNVFKPFGQWFQLFHSHF